VLVAPIAGDERLRDVLVLTVRKSFWASPESEAFARRVYVPNLVGHSTSRFNTLLMAFRTIAAVARFRPRLVVVGSAHRLVPALLLLRRFGLLRRTGLVVTNQVFFGPRLGRYADRVIVYSRRETEGRPNYVYVPIPSDGDFAAVRPERAPLPYIFAGGGELRDYASLFAAVEGTGLSLTVVTHSPATLGVEGPPPEGCQVLWRMPLDRFLAHMAGSLFVVVPLKGLETPHGHTTIAQALSLGKAVVTTRGSAVADYVYDGVEGLLVDPGDVEGYRAALVRLATDDGLRRSCEEAAAARAPEFTYAAFADALVGLCLEVMRERAG
jgi:glycosyltransferase involved in cell wall biosynthesis